MILPIITHPNDILRQQTKKVDKEDIKSKRFQHLVLDMVETMIVKNGIGLAAPQVNHNFQLLCIDINDFISRTNLHIPKNIESHFSYLKQHPALVLINPVIVSKSLRKETMEEGCLSVPNFFAKVKRHKSIKVKAMDANGNLMEFKTEGLLARVIQHETDHLNGILFIDKLDK